MKTAPLAKLENAIIKPGIEKHLHPLIRFRGQVSLGRVHRLWNFAQSMMLQECETTADGTARLALNPAFSHLAGPDKRVQSTGLRALASRLCATPEVQKLDPVLTEYIREIFPAPFSLIPVPEVTPNTKTWGVDNWRLYYSRRAQNYFSREEWADYQRDRAIDRLRRALEKKRDAERRLRNATAPKTLLYPFVIHDGGKPEHDLLRAVNAAVPKWLPEEMRADVCQDLVVGILAGDFDKDNLKLPAKEMMARVQKMFPTKYGPISLDAIMPGTDDMRLLDMISEYDGILP